MAEFASDDSTDAIQDLHHQFVDLIDKGDLKGIALMIGADSVICGEKGGPGAHGKATVVTKLQALASKAQGCIALRDEVQVMRCRNQTRSIFTVQKSLGSMKIGLALTWSGGLATYLLVIKGVRAEDFYPDDTKAPIVQPIIQPIVQPQVTIQPVIQPQVVIEPIQEHHPLNINDLNPPYLVARPLVFPPPIISINIKSCNNLKSPTLIPRPLNPFVLVSYGSSNRQTDVIRNTRNPVWQAAIFIFELPQCTELTSDDKLKIEVMDWKIGANALISRVYIPLSSLSAACLANNDDDDDVIHLIRNKKRFSKSDVNNTNDSDDDMTLTCSISKFDLYQWWCIQEIKCRDEQEMTRLMNARKLKALQDKQQRDEEEVKNALQEHQQEVKLEEHKHNQEEQQHQEVKLHQQEVKLHQEEEEEEESSSCLLS